MAMIAVLLVCLAVKGTLAEKCPTSVICPCGSKGENVTVCATVSSHVEVCSRLSKCEKCKDGFDFCMTCPEGVEGPTCSQEIHKIRQKRQNSENTIADTTNATTVTTDATTATADATTATTDATTAITDVSIDADESKDCPNSALPLFGVSKCDTVGNVKTCNVTCFAGHYVAGTEDGKEFTLTCKAGIWTPRATCMPTGACYYHQPEVARSNCTTDRHGTYCDVWCDHKYKGRFKCFAGRPWEPRLPWCLIPNPAFKQHGAYCLHPGGTPNAKVQYFGPGSKDPESYQMKVLQGGSVIKYICDEGFRLEGADRLRCEATGTWSEAVPTCVPVPKKATCRDPGFMENGVRRNANGSESAVSQTYEEGQSVVYSCISEEFAIQGSSYLTCKRDGQWSRPLPVCIRHTIGSETVKFCRDPGVDENGGRRSQSPSSPRGYAAGSWLEYSCNEGYSLVGEWSIICLSSGEWTADRPICTPNTNTDVDYCENLGIISNGQVVYHATDGNRRLIKPLDELEFPEGSRFEYSCDDGYILFGEKILICEKPGFWSDDPPFCRIDTSRRRYCLYPGDVVNGRVEYIADQNQERRRPFNPDRSEYLVGSRLRYSCEEGYTPDGPATLTCRRTGSWSPKTPPKCINDYNNDRVTCTSLGSVLNARLFYFPPGVRNGQGVQLDAEMEEYPEGSTLEYVCEKGFWLQGSHSLVCESTGSWSGRAPTCVQNCGRSFVKSTVRIINGRETKIGLWPWVVSISRQERGGSNTADFVCGGAVFSNRAVVTAAHCLETDRTYILRFGKHHYKVEDDDSEVVTRTSSRVIIHPDYTNRTHNSDIGLILFDPPIEYSTRVQPICMPTIETSIRNIVPGKVGYVSGWGLTEYDLPSESLLFAGLPVLSLQSCIQSYTRQNLSVVFTENMFCAGYFNGTYSVCKGDSGSPFVFYDDLAERYTMEGLVSFVVRRPTDAQPCGLPGRYAIFTKVFRFVPWLFENAQ